MAALRPPCVVRVLVGEQPTPAEKTMSIYVDSCAAHETIVMTTLSSVYELVVVRGDRGDVLLRGGRFFTEFSPVVFLGSMADDGSFDPDRIDIGRRVKFAFAEQVVVTSPVQSLSCHDAIAASPLFAAANGV